MIPRVTITARRDDAQTFASIASLIQLGRLEEAWQWFEREASGALARFGGAVNYALTAADRAPTCPADTQYLMHVWGDARRVELPTFGGSPIVVTLPVPAGIPTSQYLGTMRLFEFRDDPGMKQLTVSKHACDWRNELDPSGEKGPMINVGGKSATVGFGVSSGGVEDAVLSAGETYYVNMRSLVAGNWPAAYEIQWPR